jgi:hypothetical protein
MSIGLIIIVLLVIIAVTSLSSRQRALMPEEAKRLRYYGERRSGRRSG